MKPSDECGTAALLNPICLSRRLRQTAGRIFCCAAGALALLFSLTTAARADDTAKQVAVVNGFPVFHSKVLISQVKDDVDRALLLQAYEKNEAVGLPGELVDQTIKKIVTDSYKGDMSLLINDLKKKGISLEDYRQFTSEELVLAAMLTNFDKQIKAGWLAELRKNAAIEKLK